MHLGKDKKILGFYIAVDVFTLTLGKVDMSKTNITII